MDRMFCLKSFQLAMCIGVLVGAGAVGAAPLTPTSYDMINGNTSSQNTSLRDDTYTGGTGNPHTDHSSLAGGKGDLTDGITSTANWDTNPAPYVGWRQSSLASPIITFHFGSVFNFSGAAF